MSTPNLFFRLTHTGLFPDGRANGNPVMITDMDVGYEYQNRKVPIYVPVGGYIDITATSRSLLSWQIGAIKKATDAGLITTRMFIQAESYTNITRPVATLYPKGSYIWNDDDHAPNYSDGAAWRDAMGTLT